MSVFKWIHWLYSLSRNCYPSKYARADISIFVAFKSPSTLSGCFDLPFALRYKYVAPMHSIAFQVSIWNTQTIYEKVKSYIEIWFMQPKTCITDFRFFTTIENWKLLVNSKFRDTIRLTTSDIIDLPLQNDQDICELSLSFAPPPPYGNLNHRRLDYPC